MKRSEYYHTKYNNVCMRTMYCSINNDAHISALHAACRWHRQVPVSVLIAHGTVAPSRWSSSQSKCTETGYRKTHVCQTDYRQLLDPAQHLRRIPKLRFFCCVTTRPWIPVPIVSTNSSCTEMDTIHFLGSFLCLCSWNCKLPEENSCANKAEASCNVAPRRSLPRT